MSLDKKDFSGRIAEILKPPAPVKPPKPTNIPKPPISPAGDLFWSTYIKNCAKVIENRYALYIGYCYENIGWHVDYKGYRYVEDSVSEEPEELICRKENKALVIHCKAWTKGGIIYLPFVYRLIASSVEYKKDNPALHVFGISYTADSFSYRARLAAGKCNITLKENFTFSFFPYVKCKAGADGKNAHYTPYDEEYFHTDIDTRNGDLFCWTEQQAINLGF